MKILIVEDSILVRRSLIELIDPLDNVSGITEAVNVPEGIRMAREIKPDIIILDIRMPGGSGFDVLKEVKKMNEQTVVIVLTKYTTDKFREEATKYGADYFFDKSNEFEKAIDVIRDYQGD